MESELKSDKAYSFFTEEEKKNHKELTDCISNRIYLQYQAMKWRKY